MAFEFHLPDIGEGLAEATIVAWRVPVGAEVGLDEPMVEVETDKAIVEIPAPRAGIVLFHGAPDGATIAVDSLLVVIGQPGESWGGPVEHSPASATPVVRPDAKPIVGTLEEAGASVARRPGAVHALPLVRRLAAQLGVDLATISGSGPGGRIVRRDVEDAAAGDDAIERVKMSPTRIAISRNLTRSWQEIPHVTTFASADPTALLAARKSLMSVTNGSIPMEALLIEALVPVLREFPAFNAAADGDFIVYRKSYDIGVAIDAPDGLMVAVVRDAAGKDVGELAAQIVRLAEAARERTIAAADLRGASFTISNIGAVGGGFGTPIIPYGTSAILSVGRAEEQAVVVDGTIVVRKQMPLSLSYDHRLIDGATGRSFMAAVVTAIASYS